MGRPIAGPDGQGRFCPLGRETGIERVVWRDDWMYLEAGGMLPRVEVPGPSAAVAKTSETRFEDGLPPEFQWSRTPESHRIFRLDDGLALIGRESSGFWFEQALVARRQQHFIYAAETELAFDPETYQQAAGLTTYYNRSKFHALLVTYELGMGRALTILSCPGLWPDPGLGTREAPVPLADGPVALERVVSITRGSSLAAGW